MKNIILILILIIAVFASGCVKIEDGSQIETMPSQIGDAPEEEDNYYTEPVPDPVETITILVDSPEKEEPKPSSVESDSLLPKTSLLGNDLKRMNKYVSDNPEYERCPYNEMGLYNVNDVGNRAKYAILIYKCRNEQEAIDHFKHKTSSVSFSSIDGYGTEAKTIGDNVKFYYGIYYVDVGGYNSDARMNVAHDLWTKASDHVKELYDGTAPVDEAPTDSETSGTEEPIEISCRIGTSPSEFYNKDGHATLYTCPDEKPQCHISSSRDHGRAMCCKEKIIKKEYYDSTELVECTEILFKYN
jgi:hypothetical protein